MLEEMKNLLISILKFQKIMYWGHFNTTVYLILFTNISLKELYYTPAWNFILFVSAELLF